MQNREMIMHKVGKWFMIIGIAGLLLSGVDGT